MSPQRRTRTSFAPKEGETFNRRLNVRLHDDVVGKMETVKKPGDSLADVIRRAVNQYVEKELKKRRAILNRTGEGQ